MSRPQYAFRLDQPAAKKFPRRNGVATTSAPVGSVVSTVEVIAVTVEQAAALIGISRTLFYRLARTDPTFPPIVKVGRASRILVKDLQRWMAAQAMAGTSKPKSKS